MSPRSADWHVGRLHLRVPHMSEAAARRLVQDVATRLADQGPPTRDVGGLQIRIVAPAVASTESMAGQIADAIGELSR